MQLLTKSNNERVSSRQNIDIEGVQDGLLMLPGNKYRAILQVSSINFDLKNAEEQEVIISLYENFLNSLKFPIQIVIRTRTMDLDKYVADFKSKTENESNQLYREHIEHYTKFVKGLVESNKILSRQFYVVVPYDAAKDDRFELIKERVSSRCTNVSNGLSRLGMTVRPLPSVEVLDLFYSFYNPKLAKLQPVTAKTMDLIKGMFEQE